MTIFAGMMATILSAILAGMCGNVHGWGGVIYFSLLSLFFGSLTITVAAKGRP